MNPINEVQLSGHIIKVYPLKYTLHGVPILSFVLEHLSSQVEAAAARVVKCRIYCVMVNSSINLLEGRYIALTGFLNQNSKSQLVLNVKQICEQKD
ncbi:MAG: hypothetical protein KBD37_03830 [Burkholderiales bacterium]|nr:hypothetical protein [Burkholderiales bacterium]